MTNSEKIASINSQIDAEKKKMQKAKDKISDLERKRDSLMLFEIKGVMEEVNVSSAEELMDLLTLLKSENTPPVSNQKHLEE